MSVKVGTRYRSGRVDRLFQDTSIDHIVVGSGVGGLCCAAALARLGRKVLVLEQHYTAGGFTHSYLRNGYEWDVGVHYVGMVGNWKTPPGAVFHWLTKGRLRWDFLGDGFDRFVIGNSTYALPAGKRAYKKYIKSRFPNEHKAIDQYMRLLLGAEKWLPLLLSSNLIGTTSSKHKILSYCSDWLTKRVPEEYLLTTSEVLDQLTDDPDLKALWAAQWGDAGLPPDESSFFLHSMIASHYLEGAWYPRGGSSEIARKLTDTIESSGGAVMTYANVTRILVEHGQASGVIMEDDYRIDCSSIISACGWNNTKRLLLGHASLLTSHVSESELRSSSAHLCLYVGFDEPLSELKLPVGNLWVHHSREFSEDAKSFAEDTSQPFPFVYISSSAARDSEWSSRHPSKTVMELISVVPYEMFSKWSDTSWGKRPDDYLTLKEVLKDRLLSVLFEQYPHLEGRVSYSELSTPLSTKYFMKYNEGEIYGVSHTPERYQQGGLGPKTAIPGLYLAGQDGLTSGVVGAAMSGVVAAGHATAGRLTAQCAKVLGNVFAFPSKERKVKNLFRLRT